ncbi:hypothetical protein B5X24_HaOG201478 [Helicoverpa armigera]|nr:hypothetical protein B5X24_HaOG201478 [Helicoverpa armigera]
MPSISRKASLKRYFDNLKPDKNNPSPTSFTPSRVNKLTKQTLRKKTQNGRVNNNSVPQKSLYDTYKFPHNDYPLDNSPRDPFSFGNLNANHKVNTQRRTSPNPQCSAINDLKKDMKRKRKLLSNRKSNDANRISESERPLMKITVGSDYSHLLDQGSFPEVQYPLTTMETWEPKYWNCLPLTQDEKQFNSFRRDTFKSNVKDKQLSRLTKTKENKFLKSYDALKSKQRTSTENSKRSSTGEQGLNFTKTATCEKVTDDFISAGLISTIAKNVSVSKTTLEHTAESIPKSKYKITECSSDTQHNTSKKVDDQENKCLPLEVKNNTDDSNELINIINELLQLDSIEDETDSTVQACQSSTETEKDVVILDLATQDTTNEDTSPPLIENTSNNQEANFLSEELSVSVPDNDLTCEMQNTTIPLLEQPEVGNVTCMEDTSKSHPIEENVITEEFLTNSSSINPTEVSLSSNANVAPGSTSIIIIPINNNILGKSQSHVITGTPDKPIIVYIPSTQSSDSKAQNVPSEQYVSLAMEEFFQDNYFGNDLATMAPLQNHSSADLVSEIINCNSHNGSSLPMYETLPINSMCYNNESNPSSIEVIESASLELDSNEKTTRQREDINSEFIRSETLPQTPDFEHPPLDFRGSEFTLLSHGPSDDNLSCDLPIIAREINLDQKITNISSEDCIEKYNVTSKTLLINEDGRDLDVIVDKHLLPILSETYIDGANIESDAYVLPVSHADDTEIITNAPVLPEIEKYSLPVSKDEQISSSTEEPAKIIEPLPAEPSIPLDSSTANLPEMTTTELPLTQSSHDTNIDARQPIENSASILSTPNDLPKATDTTLESALLPEFQKISLLLDKMLAQFETFTTSSSQPVTTSQVPIESSPLPVDMTMKPVEATESLLKSPEFRLDESVPPTPPTDYPKKSLPLSLDEPNGPNSEIKLSAISTQTTDHKMAVTSPIKEPEPISQNLDDGIIVSVDNNKFKPIMESPLKSLQEINQPLPCTPVSESWSFPSNCDVKPSDSPSLPSHETLLPISDSNSFESHFNNAQCSQLPISETQVNSIKQLTNQLLQTTPDITSSKSTLTLPETLPSNSFSGQSENLLDDVNNVIKPYLDSDHPMLQVTFPQLNSQMSPENLCLPENKTIETPIESSEQEINKSCPLDSSIIPTFSEPNNPLYSTVDNVLPSSTETLSISQKPIDAQCLPPNITSPTFPRSETSFQSLQQQKDNPALSTPVSEAPTNRCSLNITPLPTNSVLETPGSISLDEISDNRKSDNDNLIRSLSQSDTAKASHFHGSTIDSSDSPLKMDLLLPDIFEDTGDGVLFTVNKEPTVNSLNTTSNTVPELAEFPVGDQCNATDILSARKALDNVTSDEVIYNLPENHLISDWSDSQTQEALPNDDSPLIANDTIIEIPHSDDSQRVLPQIEHLLSSEYNASPDFSGIDLPRSKLSSSNKDEKLATNQIEYRDLPLVSEAGHDGSPSDTVILLSGDPLDDIPSQRNKPYSTKTIVLTKALLESLLSEIERKEFAMPVTAVNRSKLSKLIDQSEEVEPSLSVMTQSEFPQESRCDDGKTHSDVDIFTPPTDGYQLSDIEDFPNLPVDNKLSKIPNLHISEETQIAETQDISGITTDELVHKESDKALPQLLSSPLETDLENNENTQNYLSLLNDTNYSDTNDILDKSRNSPSPSLPISDIIEQNILPDSKMTDYSIPGDQDFLISSSIDKTQVNDALEVSTPQISVDNNPPQTVLSESPTDKLISEKPENITLEKLDEKLKDSLPDIQQDGQIKNENILFENSINNLTFPVKISPSTSKLRLTKALLESVLSDLNTRVYPLPIASTWLDKMHYNVSPSLDTVANNPSQLAVDTKLEEEQNISKVDEIHSDGMVDSQILDDKQHSDENILYPSSDLPSSNDSSNDEKVDKVRPSASKLLITKALLENVLSDINTRGFPLLSKDLPKKSLLDKTIYFVEPSFSEIIDETTPSPVDETYRNNEPESETYYVVTLPADDLGFDMSIENSPIDQISNEKLELHPDDEKDKIEDLASDTGGNDSSQEMGESLSSTDHVLHETRSKPYLASKVLLTKALLEKVLSDIIDGVLSSDALPDVSIS